VSQVGSRITGKQEGIRSLLVCRRYTRGPTVQGINGRVSHKDRAPCHLLRSSNDIQGQERAQRE